MASKVLRPIAYFGGKHEIAPFVIRYMPAHECYVEVFGGGAGILLNKHRSAVEVYNDLDGEIVNLFQVMRRVETAERLIASISMTPFSRDEYECSYQRVEDSVEQARRTLVRAWMSFGRRGASGKHRDGFRYGKTRDTGYKLKQWANLPHILQQTLDRLQGVLIENLPASVILEKLDGPEVLFYLDPPYPIEDRKESRYVYRHEMTNEEHISLSRQVHELKGKVMVSGYSGLYSELFSDWQSMRTRNHTASRLANSKGRTREEFLWLSPNIEVPMLFVGELP